MKQEDLSKAISSFVYGWISLLRDEGYRDAFGVEVVKLIKDAGWTPSPEKKEFPKRPNKPKPSVEAVEIVAGALFNMVRAPADEWSAVPAWRKHYYRDTAKDILARLRSIGFVDVAKDQTLPPTEVRE